MVGGPCSGGGDYEKVTMMREACGCHAKTTVKKMVKKMISVLVLVRVRRTVGVVELCHENYEQVEHPWRDVACQTERYLFHVLHLLEWWETE